LIPEPELTKTSETDTKAGTKIKVDRGRDAWYSCLQSEETRQYYDASKTTILRRTNSKKNRNFGKNLNIDESLLITGNCVET
jgi:hypothetical protein